MARTIAQIKAALVAAKVAETELDGVTSTSKVAEWNLWLDVVAFCTYTLENLFDFFRADVDAKLATMKPHTRQWYVTKAKAFQHSVTLPPDSDVYEVVPPLDGSVLIVKEAAAEEYFGLNLLRIKVAKEVSGVLGPLSDPTELSPLRVYMNRIKDAGVRLQVTSGNPDDFKLAIEIVYDPLVLGASGARLDGTSDTPVKDAINVYLQSLPFNGRFTLSEMLDAVQAVDGVETYEGVSASANYGATPYVTINAFYIPDAGYMVLNDTFFDANVVYTPDVL